MAKVQRKLKQRNSVANTTESEQSEASSSRKGEPPLDGSREQRGGKRGAGSGVLNSGSNAHKKKKKKNKKKADPDDDNDDPLQWQVGDFCRAQYTEDAVWYEAAVISMPPGQDPPRCWVRFLGYGNTQEVAIDKLRRSQGEVARRRQIQAAEEEMSESEVGSSVAESDRHSDTDGERYTKKHKPPPPQQSGMRRMPSMPPPPFPANSPLAAPSHLPLLPPPPALARDVNGNPKTSEALHTMLMSWYMTGYHTGYYQGLTQAYASK